MKYDISREDTYKQYVSKINPYFIQTGLKRKFVRGNINYKCSFV